MKTLILALGLVMISFSAQARECSAANPCDDGTCIIGTTDEGNPMSYGECSSSETLICKGDVCVDQTGEAPGGSECQVNANCRSKICQKETYGEAGAAPITVGRCAYN